jgi:CRP-like cAMP-binding protein
LNANHKGWQIKGYLKNGDTFGEIALMFERSRTATVVTIEPTKLLVLEKADYKSTLGKLAFNF